GVLSPVEDDRGGERVPLVAGDPEADQLRLAPGELSQCFEELRRMDRARAVAPVLERLAVQLLVGLPVRGLRHRDPLAPRAADPAARAAVEARLDRELGRV